MPSIRLQMPLPHLEEYMDIIFRSELESNLFRFSNGSQLSAVSARVLLKFVKIICMIKLQFGGM